MLLVNHVALVDVLLVNVLLVDVFAVSQLAEVVVPALSLDEEVA